ncbi:DUF4244 domain-containing protein [Streptomyces sedi]|uniref:DUF4244 domain-containing protein n=1 Tax=Streptomyces sedi TaxID=555059 RepID=A0A5C4UXF9_9ACTN|nr:DUF4244 domain-containing protein [Streptomyces sedi]TNM27903.1 DUF4244 domain-containing protein [Streptomyces sedi]
MYHPAPSHPRRPFPPRQRPRQRGPLRRPRHRRARPLVHRPEAGMNTTEYAVGTLATAGFAAVLYQVLRSDLVRGELRELVQRALDVPL